MKKMRLFDIAMPQYMPDKMNLESMAAAAIRAIQLQLSHGWGTDFTCCFDAVGKCILLKLGANEYIHENGYCVRHSFVTYRAGEQPAHVCQVNAWVGGLYQSLSAIIQGLDFVVLYDEELLSAADA